MQLNPKHNLLSCCETLHMRTFIDGNSLVKFLFWFITVYELWNFLSVFKVCRSLRIYNCLDFKRKFYRQASSLETIAIISFVKERITVNCYVGKTKAIF